MERNSREHRKLLGGRKNSTVNDVMEGFCSYQGSTNILLLRRRGMCLLLEREASFRYPFPRLVVSR